MLSDSVHLCGGFRVSRRSSPLEPGGGTEGRKHAPSRAVARRSVPTLPCAPARQVDAYTFTYNSGNSVVFKNMPQTCSLEGKK